MAFFPSKIKNARLTEDRKFKNFVSQNAQEKSIMVIARYW